MGNRKQKKRIKTCMMIAQNHKCFYCQEEISEETVTADHVFPRSAGYGLKGNAVASCADCNIEKCSNFPGLYIIFEAIKLYEKAGLIFEPVFEIGDSPYPTRKENCNFWLSIGIGRTPQPTMWEMTGVTSDDELIEQIGVLLA